MPRAKKSGSKKSAKTMHEMIDTKTEDLFPAAPEGIRPAGSHFYRNRWTYAIVIALLGVAVYFGMKGYIVAAVVNGQPVFGWDVERSIMARYGTQMLDSLVSERLVAGAAGKSGITVSQADVDGKIAELMKTLGANVKLEDVLAYQGVTKADFQKQVKLQLTIEKLLGKDITITEADIDGYIEKNKDTLTATDEAAMREEAKQTLFSQAISQKIQPWFNELKAKAQIIRILK
jgi:hypothetical protein